MTACSPSWQAPASLGPTVRFGRAGRLTLAPLSPNLRSTTAYVPSGTRPLATGVSDACFHRPQGHDDLEVPAPPGRYGISRGPGRAPVRAHHAPQRAPQEQ